MIFTVDKTTKIKKKIFRDTVLANQTHDMSDSDDQLAVPIFGVIAVFVVGILNTLHPCGFHDLLRD